MAALHRLVRADSVASRPNAGISSLKVRAPTVTNQPTSVMTIMMRSETDRRSVRRKRTAKADAAPQMTSNQLARDWVMMQRIAVLIKAASFTQPIIGVVGL